MFGNSFKNSFSLFQPKTHFLKKNKIRTNNYSLFKEQNTFPQTKHNTHFRKFLFIKILKSQYILKKTSYMNILRKQMLNVRFRCRD
jgi:hypothetical protein